VANSVVIDPNGKETEFVGPVSHYEVVQSNPPAADTRFVAAEIDAPQGEASGAEVQKAAAAPPRPAKATAKPGAKNDPSSKTKAVILAGVGMGLLAGLMCAVLFTHPGPVDNSTDMGSVTSNTTGLKGHLITNWGDRLDYKLSIEPSDPSQLAGFSNAVINSPRPLSINVQLKSVTGAVLCDDAILLKFDPLKRSAIATATPVGKGKKVDEILENRAQVAQALNNARMVSQELDREHGKDIFQNNVGSDGQVASISAQGTLPCSRKQYESTASWGFTSNFPVVIPVASPHTQDSKQNDNSLSAAVTSDRISEAQSAASKRRKIALPVSRFFVEEDDTAVGYQAQTGIIETRAGKAFQMEKRDLVSTELKGVDFPINVHYRCDQFGACALAGIGPTIQRAWMER
jgi:hypothetical protein